MNLLTNSILALKRKVLQLKSNARNKKEFLLRPDLGRQLNNESKPLIKENVADKKYDICISISDGLSAEAVNNHVLPLLHLLFQKTDASVLTIAPICIVENGRVAISDETGFLSNAKISLILIGERPGLTAPDSMGAYLTYEPKLGNTDAGRNCISNIHSGGLAYNEAAHEIFNLLTQSMQMKLSGSKLSLQNNYNLNQ
jgi:ethanolamine ammonia-lyase small subunit